MKPTRALLSVLLAASGAASAAPLIGFTDNSAGQSWAHLSDESVNWAVSWTQSVASSNVTLRAILESNVGLTSANWYVTTAIGPGTGAGAVVYSGTYSPPPAGALDTDFNDDVRTELASGLDFAAGTYFLVLDGPPGQFVNNARWVGDTAGTVTVSLATGFTLGSYYAVIGAASFAPAGNFAVNDDFRFVFELESFDGNVPVAPTLPLVAGALGVMALRRRR